MMEALSEKADFKRDIKFYEISLNSTTHGNSNTAKTQNVVST